MKSEPARRTVPPPEVVVQLALEQSKGVKAKVEACADELVAANTARKEEIAAGATVLPAHAALAESEAVESKVQECAADLHEVTETLAQGVDDHARVELALSKSQRALALSEASLATSQAQEKKARLAAMHDSATGLPNRELFDDRLGQAIALAARQQWTLAVMFLDLDSFKRVNDEHGHAAGDRVLKEVAMRLRRSCRSEDTVCRTGGDEFLFLLTNPRGRDNIQRVADAVSASASAPIDVDGVQLVVGVSIGIAVYPSDASTGAELIAKADEAMYRAKRQNGGAAFFEATDALRRPR